MSALPPEADIALHRSECPLYPQKRTLHCTAANVRFVPKADIRRRSKTASLFDHLVGASDQRWGYSQTERLRGL